MVVLLTLTGCSFFAQPTPIPHRSQLLGTWVHLTSEGERSTLELSADGTFTAERIPAEVFAYSGGPNFTSTLDWSKTQDLHGRWTLAKDRNVGDAPYLDVTISPSRYPIYGHTVIQVDGSGSGLRLNAEVGPVDDGALFGFSRTGS